MRRPPGRVVAGARDRQRWRSAARQRRRKALIVARQASETAHPGETAFHEPALWRRYTAVTRLGSFDDDEAQPLRLRCRLLADVGGVSVEDLDCSPVTSCTRWANPLIYCRSAAMAGVTANSKSVPMASTTAWTLELRTALMPIRSDTLSAFHRRAQRATVHNRRARLRVSS
jgi:hypothetical protein